MKVGLVGWTRSDGEVVEKIIIINSIHVHYTCEILTDFAFTRLLINTWNKGEFRGQIAGQPDIIGIIGNIVIARDYHD